MIPAVVESFLRKYSLLSSDNSFLVAFSGGVDSTCLLNSLHSLSMKFGFKVLACHINHQWRGKESFDDESYVTNFCNKLNIPIFIERLDPALPRNEVVARDKRYELLNKVANENKICILLTAHTQSDQIETILLRIIKGSGNTGLKGIPEIRKQINGPDIYRPLLTLSRQNIEEFVKENNLPVILDKTNFDEKILRNSIRHSLIPKLKEYNPKVDEALLRLSQISEQNENIIDYFLQPVFRKVFETPLSLKTKEFFEIPEFLQPSIVMKLVSNAGLDYDYRLIERLINYIATTKLTHAGKKYSLLQNFYLYITQRNIKIVSPELITVIQSTSKVAIPGITELTELNIKLKVTEYKKDFDTKIQFPASNANIALADLSGIKNDIYIRTRREGDTIRPLGMKGTMKLKKYLINHHIPQEKKSSLPVLAIGNEILWVAGVGLSDKIKVITCPTHVLEIIRG